MWLCTITTLNSLAGASTTRPQCTESGQQPALWCIKQQRARFWPAAVGLKAWYRLDAPPLRLTHAEWHLLACRLMQLAEEMQASQRQAGDMQGLPSHVLQTSIQAAVQLRKILQLPSSSTNAYRLINR